MEEADAWAKQNSPKRALELIRAALRNAPDAPAVPLLRKMEKELSEAKPCFCETLCCGHPEPAQTARDLTVA